MQTMNLTTISAVLNLIPAIIKAITAIEEALPDGGKGEQKLLAIRTIIESVDEKAKEIWPTIQVAINVLVNLFNVTKWKK